MSGPAKIFTLFSKIADQRFRRLCFPALITNVMVNQFYILSSRVQTDYTDIMFTVC